MTPPEETRLEPWTAEDEKALEDFRSEEIDIINDKALGRREAVKRRELKAAIPTMSKAELEDLKLKQEIAEAERIVPEVAGMPI